MQLHAGSLLKHWTSLESALDLRGCHIQCVQGPGGLVGLACKRKLPFLHVRAVTQPYHYYISMLVDLVLKVARRRKRQTGFLARHELIGAKAATKNTTDSMLIEPVLSKSMLCSIPTGCSSTKHRIKQRHKLLQLVALCLAFNRVFSEPQSMQPTMRATGYFSETPGDTSP